MAGLRPPAAPTSGLGVDYDTAWSRKYPARLARAVVLDNLTRPLARVVASPLVRGDESLRGLEGPVIFAANHVSHVDTPLLLSSLPLPFRHRTVVAAAADYFFDRRWKADAWSFFLAAIPIERTKVNRRSAQLAADLLEEGWNLVIFPEGGRSPDGWAQTFRGGAAYLAARTGCPVVPIHIDGTRHILPKGTNAVRRTRTTITFGTPLSPTEDEDARRFGSRIEAAVATMANEVTTDWWSARKQAAAGVTPALQGPNVAPWRRTWRLPEPPPPRDSGAEDGADETACGPGAAKRRRPRRGSAVPPGALGGPPTDRRPTPAVRREGPTPRHRREVPGRRSRHPLRPTRGGGRPGRRCGPESGRGDTSRTADQTRHLRSVCRPRCPRPAPPGRPTPEPGPSAVTALWFSKPVSTGSGCPVGSRGESGAGRTTTSPTARPSLPFTVVRSRSSRPACGVPALSGKVRPSSWYPAHTPSTTAPRWTARPTTPSARSASAARTSGPSSPPPMQ